MRLKLDWHQDHHTPCPWLNKADFAVGMQQQDLHHQLKRAKWYSIHFKGHTQYVDPCLLSSDPVITYRSQYHDNFSESATEGIWIYAYTTEVTQRSTALWCMSHRIHIMVLRPNNTNTGTEYQPSVKYKKQLGWV